MTDATLERARIEAAAARARLLSTAQELHYRLKPSTLADEARDAVVRKSEALAEGAVDVAMRRPIAASATVAGLGALLGAGVFFRRRAHDRAK